MDLVHQGITFHQVDFPHYMDEIGALRAKVWLEQGKLSPDSVKDGKWLDGYDHGADHWVALFEGRVVASARLHIAQRLEDLPYSDQWLEYGHLVTPPVALIMRLVVDSEFRGRGLATQLDRLRIEAARQNGAKVVLANAGVPRQDSLEKIGFVVRAFRTADSSNSGLENVEEVLMSLSL